MIKAMMIVIEMIMMVDIEIMNISKSSSYSYLVMFEQLLLHRVLL